METAQPAVVRLSRRDALSRASRIRFWAMCLMVQKLRTERRLSLNNAKANLCEHDRDRNIGCGFVSFVTLHPARFSLL